MLINSPSQNLYTSRLESVGYKRKKSYLNLTSSKPNTPKSSLRGSQVGLFQFSMVNNNNRPSNETNKIYFQRSAECPMELSNSQSHQRRIQNTQNNYGNEQLGTSMDFINKKEKIRNQKPLNKASNKIYFGLTFNGTQRKISNKKKKLSLSIDKNYKKVQKTTNQNRNCNQMQEFVDQDYLVKMQIELPSMESSNPDY